MSITNIKQIRLAGRVFIRFDIEAVTGLHIGGSDVSVEIGGVDKTVIRDKLTNRPYIPGSSLRGKVRSLLEKYKGLKQNKKINKGYIHSCESKAPYDGCDLCQVFGVAGDSDFGTPTRMIVRDTFMSTTSAAELNKAPTDLPFTEVKTEVAIDRVTSAANPRQLERVPAGSIFGGASQAEIVYVLYEGDDCNLMKDIDRLSMVVEGLSLLEDDYLGGAGSRGSGKVKLSNFNIKTSIRKKVDTPEETHTYQYGDLSKFKAGLVEIQNTLK
ncbi:MAG: type III-A CRISPR-associated RAMP protein Csm3 [Chloroflexota bacterium]